MQTTDMGARKISNGNSSNSSNNNNSNNNVPSRRCFNHRNRLHNPRQCNHTPLISLRPLQDLYSLTFPKQRRFHSSLLLFRICMANNPNSLGGNFSLNSRVLTSLSTTRNRSSNYTIRPLSTFRLQKDRSLMDRARIIAVLSPFLLLRSSGHLPRPQVRARCSNSRNNSSRWLEAASLPAVEEGVVGVLWAVVVGQVIGVETAVAGGAW
jgi:hypothetical protein